MKLLLLFLPNYILLTSTYYILVLDVKNTESDIIPALKVCLLVNKQEPKSK